MISITTIATNGYYLGSSQQNIFNVHPGLFLVYFVLFQTNINTILQQINEKNVHPV